MKTTFCLAVIGLAAGIAIAQDMNKDKEKKTTTTTTTSATTAQTETRANAPAEAKTQSYKGTLVDASCAAPGSMSSTTTTSTTSTASTETQKSSTPGAESTTAAQPPSTGDANRAAGSCAVSTNTTEFALKMDDGRVVRFDSVGNMRAQEALKASKKWTEAAGSGKPIHAKVSGMMSGDKLVVMSVH